MGLGEQAGAQALKLKGKKEGSPSFLQGVGPASASPGSPAPAPPQNSPSPGRPVPHIWREMHIWRETPAYSRCSWSGEQPYPHATGSEGTQPPSCPVCTAPQGQHHPGGRNICRFATSQVQVRTPEGGNKWGGINAQHGAYHSTKGRSNAASSHFPQAHCR